MMTNSLQNTLKDHKVNLGFLIAAGILLYLVLAVYVASAIWPIGDWNYHLRGAMSEAAITAISINMIFHTLPIPRGSYPSWRR